MARNYTDICSEKTLQTSNEGFFLEFADNIAESAGKNWVDKTFGKLKNDRERLRIIYEFEPVKKPLTDVFQNIQQLYRKKSSKIASSCLKEAERALNENLTLKSLCLYSQCILRAETGQNLGVDNGKTLSLGLLGRASVLIQMNRYDLALCDVQLALKESVTENLKGEAYFKIAVCYKALGEDKKATVAFNLAQKFSNDLEEVLKAKYRNAVTSTVHFEKPNIKDIPKLSGKPNTLFPHTIEKLKVKETTHAGRYIVAGGKINTGETIVVEEPTAACLKPESFGTHCQNCFVRLIAPIGCPTCSNVAFCGTSCRDQALRSYHKYECKILELLLGSGMSILSHLAFRMITQNELEENLSIYRNRKNEHIFTLCTNSTKRKSDDFFRRTLMAAFLLRCLQKVDYFSDSEDHVTPTENELIIGEMLLFYLQLLQFNAHEIYEKVHAKSHRFKGCKLNCIGVGLYSSVALFNHQCYPSVTRYFVGKSIVIKAIRPLKVGETVAENYGPIFTKQPLQVRQKNLLSRYWFKCECTPCAQNWPTINSEGEEVSSRLKCPTKNCNQFFTLPLRTFDVNCIQCKKNISLEENYRKLEWCEDQFHTSLQKMDQMLVEEAITVLKKALDTFHTISTPPHKSTHLAEETLKACYADYGNSFEVVGEKQSDLQKLK